MKVFYHSAFDDIELKPGSALRAIPCKACLKLYREKTEGPCELLYNGTLIGADVQEIECNEEAELVVRQNGERFVYSVRPLVPTLPMKFSKAYEQFGFEYRNMELSEIDSVQLGALKLYAVDQNTEVRDYTEIFDQIESAFPPFKAICENPKSHLKAVNEVRPIETVKRIGYESIPYLAAHSEDWLARTASGLKPARLFSRVEDDEYHIYENRVVKTLIDLILAFLRKTEKQLRDQRDQLRGIMNSSVQTGSFGFDVGFQKAVAELMSSDDKGDEYRSKSLELVEKLQKRAYSLLKHYRTLRQTRLYRYLRKAKTVSNPLNETNILTMDKYYSVVFKLWKAIHHVIAPKTIEKENQIAFDDTCSDYQQFCAALCGYTAHVLNFELVENGRYIRKTDNIEMQVDCMDNGLIKVTLKDIALRSLIVPNGIAVPIASDEYSERIHYDGCSLIWPNDITDDEIDAFCSKFKTRESRGREQSEEKRKYTTLKSLIDQTQRSYKAPKETCFLIFPAAIELGTESRSSLRTAIEKAADHLMEEYNVEQIIVAFPICNENEQKVTEYAKTDGQIVSFLPITMFDINSFRRMQNVLYREIIKIDKKLCPNCGGALRERSNQYICDNCNQLIITRTICPNPECKMEYLYMGYDIDKITMERMQAVSEDNFFDWDSLFQYKDIVQMSVKTGRLHACCPHCGK